MIKNKQLLLIILIIFILAAAGSFSFFLFDQWHIEIDDGSENNVKIEYGDTYDDGTVTAALKGRYLLKKGFPVAVTSEVLSTAPSLAVTPSTTMHLSFSGKVRTVKR
mgnify:CR=1 FL=1